MIKQRKKYNRPRKPFDRARIDEEDKIIKKYGLKSKREIWKADFYIDSIRNQAKHLIIASEKEQKDFVLKLAKIGLVKEDARIDDILGLTKENVLDRRLQTVVMKKGFATKPKQARQLITHKHVLVSGKVVDVPSFIVSEKLEKEISLKEKKQKKKKEAVLPEQVDNVPSPAHQTENEKVQHTKPIALSENISIAKEAAE